MMKKLTILAIILYSALLSFSQNDTLTLDKKKTDRFAIWLIPSAATNIYGIAIGVVGSEAICHRPYTKFSHGLNFQIIGQGFFQTFYINKMKFSELHLRDNNSTGIFNEPAPMRAIHNGLILSPFGTFTDQVNGISFSLWMSMGMKINGLTFNLLWNRYEQINGISIGIVNHAALTKGLQIGILNKTKKLQGMQIGLWNKNEKRSLPLINWNFKK
ncbi:hypothetical protein MASR2M12_11860 [Bacteroidales bacterium]